MIQVLFVCMGNICRSPTAEIIFTHHLNKTGLNSKINCDSAGTHGYHVGCAPDARSQAAVKSHGLDMSHLRARQVSLNDFKVFDYIIAMDIANLENLHSLASDTHREKISLLLSHAKGADTLEVPDPYYGGDKGFNRVYELIESGVLGLISQIQHTHKL